MEKTINRLYKDIIMLTILIMDDSPKKIETVKKVLIEGCGIDEKSITVAKSVAAGRNAVRDKYFDIVLLDLVLPLFEEEDPIEDGGLSFIKQITSAGTSIKLPTQIIGLTEKDEAYKTEKEEFQSLLFNVIHCKQGDNEWINQIQQVVNLTLRSKDAIIHSLRNKYLFDIGIICALSEEFKQMIEAFGGEEKWENVEIEEDLPFLFKSTIVTTAQNVIRVVAATPGRPGVIPTAVVSTLLYTLFRVKTVFMTGFSAGFPSNKLQLGDILIASSIEDYASGKLIGVDGSIKLLKEVHQIEAPTTLVLKMQELLDDESTQPIVMSKIKKNNLQKESRESYQPMMAATCCGPYVVTSNEAVNNVKEQNRKLEGLDMEGYGLYLTSKILTNEHQKGAMWMKGVGDFANPDKTDGYHDTCSYGSASLLYHFIKEKL